MYLVSICRGLDWYDFSKAAPHILTKQTEESCLNVLYAEQALVEDKEIPWCAISILKVDPETQYSLAIRTELFVNEKKQKIVLNKRT